MPPTVPASGVRPAASAALADELRAIAAAASVDGLERALRVLATGARASAGAICLYQQREDVLRLAVEIGLSEEGRRRLETVRRGGMAGWDMPLHGLLNRRAYLIESAAQNRYVPPLVEAVASIRTVACLPVYAGNVPLASVILVACAPHAIGDAEIRALAEPLRELPNVVRSVKGESTTRTAAPATPSRATPDADRARLEESLAAARAREAEITARLGELERLVDLLRAERDHFAMQETAADEALARLEEGLARQAAERGEVSEDDGERIEGMEVVTIPAGPGSSRGGWW